MSEPKMKKFLNALAEHFPESVAVPDPERTAFEAAMAKRGYHMPPALYRDGTYRDTCYSAGWDAWQAATAEEREACAMACAKVRADSAAGDWNGSTVTAYQREGHFECERAIRQRSNVRAKAGQTAPLQPE